MHKLLMTIAACVLAMTAVAHAELTDTGDKSTDAIVILLVVLALYLLPAIVASTRHHRDKLAITWLNILLGWSLLGWIAALIWACTGNVEPRPPRSRERLLGRSVSSTEHECPTCHRIVNRWKPCPHCAPALAPTPASASSDQSFL